MIYDLLIIGAGPAGFTAGIYAARREMKTIIIGKELGGQIAWASDIENYPGFKSIKSYELIEKMSDHVKSLGVEIVSGEVQEIKPVPDGELFTIITSNKSYQAKTIILAMGLFPRRLAIPGEIELGGKGVSYCANCDGPFYRGKKVAVVGGGNAALDAAEVLSKIASQVYLVHRREEFRAFEELVNEIERRPNIEAILNSDIAKITGETNVKSISVKNNVTGQSRDIDVDGVFVEIGRIAHTDLVAGLVDRDEKNQILIDEKCRTKTPGLFAAGDVTQVPYKQISIACGQATIAALAAYEFIQLKQGKGIQTIVDRGKKG